MLFNSIDFMIFFPIVLIIYFIVPAKIRSIWLLLSSYYFYMSWNPVYAALILISTIITFGCGSILQQISERVSLENPHRILGMRFAITVSLIFNIGVLFYFKYTDFALDTINGIFGYINVAPVNLKFDIVLPIGISFYTFQALGYVIDVYRGNVKAERNFLKYALFVSFFPQLLAGPIGRSKSILSQITENSSKKMWDYRRVASGMILMLWGYFLKIVIADRIAVLVNTVFEHYYIHGMVALTAGAVGFALQIYCDFAGYSTIAVGAAKVLGFELIENFHAPYFATGVVDFWRRWHISLSTWFKDYLYIPLGGSRCSKGKKYRNIIITFVVSGLWHGANWTFVAWGLLHGLYQVIESELKPGIAWINSKLKTKTESIGYRFGQVVITFIFIDIAWIFFRADSIGIGIDYIRRMVTHRDWWSLFDESIYTLGLNYREMNLLVFSLFILLLVDMIRVKKRMALDTFLAQQWIVFRWIVVLFLLFFTIVFGYYGPGFASSRFIYLQF